MNISAFGRGFALASTLVLLCASFAQADFQDGRWRVQVSVQTGVDSGGVERGGDVLTMATVEYEVPLTPHVCYNLKLDPVFHYTQGSRDVNTLFDGEWGADHDELDLDFHDRHGGDGVLGAGIGLGLRVYQKAEEKRGVFLDLGVHALGHSGEFNGNTSNINFMSGIGLGYQLKGGLNAQLRFDHLSNGGLAEENSGTNVIGLGLGYRF